jgi:hypothetical protein
MQQPTFTPAHAQHMPAGWNFPTLTVPQAPQPAAAPVTGGGATSTVTRVRWGRLLPVFAGIVLLAFGVWSVSHDGSSAPSSKTVSGGGATDGDLQIARSARTDIATADEASTGAAEADAADDAAVVDSAAADAAPPAATAPRTTPVRTARPVRHAARRPGVRRTVAGGGAGVAATRVSPSVAANGASAPRAGARGGGAPAGELPMTGIETWIAGILGALLLTIGICVHVNAVRIATTAMLYRRGILLRPVECARLAQEQGLPQSVRVWLSDVLHKLLEEPAHGDFVATRMAR